MSELNEKFFIPRPELTTELLSKGDGKMFPAYRAEDGELLKWSAPFPLPEIGTRIYVTLNGIGWAEVKGYMSSAGWLGVMTLPENPPAWLREQIKRQNKEFSSSPKRFRPPWMQDGIGCEFGAEIALTKP
jgi:hypothetical protein